MFILFDENVPYKFVQGLELIESSNHKSPIVAKVAHPKMIGNTHATDEEQIVYAGKHKGIIFSFDKDFKSIKSYYPLYKEHNVGVVLLTLGKKESNYWGIVKLIINNWEDLKQKLHNVDKPFVYQVARTGITRLEF